MSSTPPTEPVKHPAGEPDDTPKSAAARLFDIRLLIGGLFVLYGVMLTIAGLFITDSQRAKADGININLFLGIGMLILGIAFLVWRALNPIKIERPEDDMTEGAPRAQH
jgi:hypothetical protein